MAGTVASWVRLPITGASVVVDVADMRLLDVYKWHMSDTGYAVWRGITGGTKRTFRLHRLINNTPDGLDTDHINQVKVDNRRSNLRSVTRSDNNRNSAKRLHYCWDASRDKWMVRWEGKYIGRYSTEAEAIKIVSNLEKGILV